MRVIDKSFATQKICDKAVDTYPSTIKYVPDRCKTQGMCDKVVFMIDGRLKKYVIKPLMIFYQP